MNIETQSVAETDFTPGKSKSRSPESGEIKLNSVKQKKKPVELLRQNGGMMYLKDAGALEVAEIVDAVKADGHNRMAQVVRMAIIDVFKEAWHAGHISPGYNPVQAVRGDKVSASSITTTFKKARNHCGITWAEGAAPAFHEQRSLSERLYREQGGDTQKLPGHTSQKMTDRYHDDRGKDWIMVAV